MKTISIATLVAFTLPAGCFLWWTPAFAAVEIIDPRDTLDKAVAGLDLIGGKGENTFSIYAADRELIDSNVFRLPSGTDAAAVVGPSATKQDHINSPAAGLDGQWGLGKQFFSVELTAQDNRYANNSNLNNVSTSDKAVWNWGLGSVLTGQVGASYLRALAGFVNTNTYTRNVYYQTNTFAAGRYQIGPRWAFYGGLLKMDVGLDQASAKGNDSRGKSVDVGAEFVTNVEDTFGVDYRYTDVRYPNGIALSGTVFAPDFRDERVRLLMKRMLSEKTSIDVGGGYLRRTYGNSLIGSFAGPIWRGSLGWQPTDKTQFLVSTWRNLQAYFTDQTNYYRSTGASVSPIWNASEKISIALLVTREGQAYIGSSPIEPSQSSRRDTVNGQAASITYTPTRALTFDVSYHHEQRDSNQRLRTYTDGLTSAGVKFVF